MPDSADAQELAAPITHPATAAPPPPSIPFPSIFALPPALRSLFASFPLTTYPSNPPPARCAPAQSLPSLYIFSASKDNAPSHNPSCLKWQTYLHLRGVPFEAVASNNHASPSGALPFLIPGGGGKDAGAVAGGKIGRWVADRAGGDEAAGGGARDEAYLALLDHRLRRAWLAQLYLDPRNEALLTRLYVEPCSTNPLVRFSILRQLRRAADDEVRKSNVTGGAIAEDELLGQAEDALRALEDLLGESGAYFSSTETPGLFDAAVFAYTHLLLDDAMRWGSNELGERLRACPGLVEHEGRIRARCGW